MRKSCRAVPTSWDTLCPQPQADHGQRTHLVPTRRNPGADNEDADTLNLGNAIFIWTGSHGKQTRSGRQIRRKTLLLLPHQTWPRPHSFQALGCRRRALERRGEPGWLQRGQRQPGQQTWIGAAQHQRQRDPGVGVCRGGLGGAQSAGIAWDRDTHLRRHEHPGDGRVCAKREQRVHSLGKGAIPASDPPHRHQAPREPALRAN